eukprot:scaffold2767_cov177-Amphora_coffeaeformis.AAC.3
MEEICDLEIRLKVAESLSIRQSRREIATGMLAEGVRISDDEWTVDLLRHDVCFLTDLLDSEIRLGDLGSTPLRISDKWEASRWLGWRLTDDLVLVEMAHPDFSIRFSIALDPSIDRLFHNAGLSLGSPCALFAHELASQEYSIPISLTTLHIRAVSDWVSP